MTAHSRQRVSLLVVALLALSACTPAAGPIPPDTVPSAVRGLLDDVTAAAGSVPQQQAVLNAAVDPAGGLAGCAPATTTVRLEPVWAAVHPVPDWTPATGRPPVGTVYAVPAVLRIVQDGVVTATDLATLHVGVTDDTARLAPFCLR